MNRIEINNVIWRYPFNQSFTQYERMPNINLSGGGGGICAYYTARFLYYGLLYKLDCKAAIERLKQDCIAPSSNPMSILAGFADSSSDIKKLADEATLEGKNTFGLTTLVDLNKRGSLARLYTLGSPLNNSVIAQNLMDLTYSDRMNQHANQHIMKLWQQFDENCKELFVQTWTFKDGDEIKIFLKHPSINSDLYNDREIVLRLAYEKLMMPYTLWELHVAYRHNSHSIAALYDS